MTVPETSPADVLRAARALIEDPERWCQGVAQKEEARCMFAALTAVGGFTFAPALRYLARACYPLEISTYNDTHTHARVLGRIDRAIVLAKKAKR